MRTENWFFKGCNANAEKFYLGSCCGGGHNQHGGGHANHSNENMTGSKYQCPMKCEGDKIYHQPGNCPVCNMKLMPIN